MRAFDYVAVEQAATLLADSTQPPGKPETVSLMEASGRVAWEDVAALGDQPPFDRSPLDGYAVDHRDLADVDHDHPARLRVVETIYAGYYPSVPVGRGKAVRLMTGSPIPHGATCVVRQEDTETDGETVMVRVRLGDHDNFCDRGEDVRTGQTLVRRGDMLDSGRIGLLASQGMTTATVFPRPRLGILSTGSELVPGGSSLTAGRIYDSNRFLLAACAREAGVTVSAAITESDDPERIAAAIRGLLDASDVVATTGGVSVGAHDYLPEAAAILGARTLFHGVAVRPGSPALALHLGGIPVVCLSGNPFAAYITFTLLVGPVLRRVGGHSRILPLRARGVLADAFPKKSPVRRFVPALIVGDRVSLPGGGQSARSTASLADCNCLLDIPPHSPALAAGAAVEVVLRS